MRTKALSTCQNLGLSGEVSLGMIITTKLPESFSDPEIQRSVDSKLKGMASIQGSEALPRKRRHLLETTQIMRGFREQREKRVKCRAMCIPGNRRSMGFV